MRTCVCVCAHARVCMRDCVCVRVHACVHLNMQASHGLVLLKMKKALPSGMGVIFSFFTSSEMGGRGPDGTSGSSSSAALSSISSSSSCRRNTATGIKSRVGAQTEPHDSRYLYPLYLLVFLVILYVPVKKKPTESTGFILRVAVFFIHTYFALLNRPGKGGVHVEMIILYVKLFIKTFIQSQSHLINSAERALLLNQCAVPRKRDSV